MSTIPRAPRLRLLSPRRTAAAAAPGGAGVAMVIGATSKWQSGGANTLLVHGRALPDDELPPSAKWGVGGAVALEGKSLLPLIRPHHDSAAAKVGSLFTDQITHPHSVEHQTDPFPHPPRARSFPSTPPPKRLTSTSQRQHLSQRLQCL